MSEDKAARSDLSSRELFLNVSWNIWRGIAEATVFLVPFFLSPGGDTLNSIPLSIFVGLLIGVVLGAAIYIANLRFKDLKALAIFMSLLTGLLAVGLFTYGCHEFEEIAKWEIIVYEIHGEFWSHKKFPFVIAKIFGYSDHPSLIQVLAWCLGMALLTFTHFRLYKKNKENVAVAAKKQKQVEGLANTL